MKITILFPFIILFVFYKHHASAQQTQPFFFKIKNLQEVLSYLGTPTSEKDHLSINRAIAAGDESAVDLIISILDAYTLFNIEINPESRVKATTGLAKPILQQNGWTTFLIKVENQAGITAPFLAESKQAKRDYDGGEKIYGMGGANKGSVVAQQDITDRWLDMDLYTKAPMTPRLSGLKMDYFIIQLYGRDAGKRAARFSFSCGQATEDVGFNSQTDVLFQCAPASSIQLEVLDENRRPSTASLIIRDKLLHIYPSQAKRLAPDFFFQLQIYRSNGESIDLPAGVYSIDYGRGPEYLTKTIQLDVTGQSGQVLKLPLERWINPAAWNWYSGDHHIHAAGCSHYTTPTEGVNPEDMMRHLLGEAVNVGSVLTWGPGYYHQKHFFEGKDNALSTPDCLMRYDLEISGFPSSHAGHLVLLRLKDQDYPNTQKLEDWPTWTIPVLRWAKAQGAITGYAHSGLGLEVKTDRLPNYDMPRFDGIGANEYIVAVTQNLVDFISTMDTPPTWELNIWYHTLNCGFRTRISGETDFPCMSDEKVAHGRSYVKLTSGLNFNDWAEGLKSGKTYTSDGKSHIMDFKVNDAEVGTHDGEIHLVRKSQIHITAKVAAYLPEKIDTSIHILNIRENVWRQKPFWNIERGRIGNTRTVMLELIVNGEAVATKPVLADGKVRDVSFDQVVDKSSWVALKIMPSSHTNPVFVIVNGQPIRASKKSAQWCLQAVDQCWSQKSGNIAPAEKKEAAQIYEAARGAYRKIIAESVEE